MIKIFALLLILFCPLRGLAAEAPVEGRVFTENGPLPGAKVLLYSSFADIRGGEPAVSTGTDATGVYRMHISPGGYYAVARGEQGGKQFFAYPGKNPITIDKEGLWLAFEAVASTGKPAYSPGPTAIEGRLLFKGAPIEGGFVALYDPGIRNFRGRGIRNGSTGSEGVFKLATPPGKYVVVGRKVASGKSNLPPQKGDLYCYYPSNPVEVREGQTVRLDLSCYPKNDRAAFVNTPPVKDNVLKTLAELPSPVAVDAAKKNEVAVPVK